MPLSNAPQLTALIIIADEELRSSLEKPLRRAGFKIRDATNGEDGLRLAMEAPDLIALDLHLPDMSGFEVRCRLKARATTAPITWDCQSAVPIHMIDLANWEKRNQYP